MADSDSWMLIAGLGNPGEKYQDTRHNIGFLVIDELARRWEGQALSRPKFKGLGFNVPRSEGRPNILLLKPQTFMNLSGESIAEAARFYKIPVQTHLLVCVDDLDLPEGALRLRLSGGAGGHNGLKSIIECLGTDAFPRLRLGIGRSATLPADAYVLAKIPVAARPVYKEMARRAADGVERCLSEGMARAMNWINQRSEVK